MTYSRGTTAASELTARPVSTWPEGWQIETEARSILAISKEQRDTFFNGRKDENGRTINRGGIGTRGLKSVVEIRSHMERLQVMRRR